MKADKFMDGDHKTRTTLKLELKVEITVLLYPIYYSGRYPNACLGGDFVCLQCFGLPLQDLGCLVGSWVGDGGFNAQ